MPGAIEAIIVAMFSVAGLAIPVVILVVILKAVSGSRRTAGLQEDEARMMQEIYRSLGRMEERIDALETLVLDPKDKARVDK